MTRYNQCFVSMAAVALLSSISQESGVLVHSFVTPNAAALHIRPFASSRHSIFALSGTSLDDENNTEQIPSSASPAADSIEGQPKEEGTTPPTSPPPETLRMQSSNNQRPVSSQDLMMAMGTNPRRIAISLLSASGIAIAGNFLGVTSRLLTAVPEETVEASGLDTYFPRGDYKRCRGKGYTFVVPKNWVADTFVELAKAQQKVKQLDYSMSKRRSAGNTLPDSAYGPAGRLVNGVSETGDTNVSVIVSTGLSGFTLERTLGTPQDAAEKLLRLSIAPEGSGRTATLESAIADTTTRPGGQKVYQFEFVVDRGNPRLPPIRNLSVIAASPAGDTLYTLTVVAPVQSFENKDNAEKLRKIASSFHLTL